MDVEDVEVEIDELTMVVDGDLGDHVDWVIRFHRVEERTLASASGKSEQD